MAQASIITVMDREATPVAHNFAPRMVAPGASAVFVEKASVPIGERKFTIRTYRKGQQFHVKLQLDSPTLVTETVNGVAVPKVPRSAFIVADFRFAETSTDQERKNAVGMFANALAASQTMITSCLVDLEGVW